MTFKEKLIHKIRKERRRRMYTQTTSINFPVVYVVVFVVVVVVVVVAIVVTFSGRVAVAVVEMVVVV